MGWESGWGGKEVGGWKEVCMGDKCVGRGSVWGKRSVWGERKCMGG